MGRRRRFDCILWFPLIVARSYFFNSASQLRGLHFFVGMVHKKAIPVQRDVE